MAVLAILQRIAMSKIKVEADVSGLKQAIAEITNEARKAEQNLKKAGKSATWAESRGDMDRIQKHFDGLINKALKLAEAGKLTAASMKSIEEAANRAVKAQASVERKHGVSGKLYSDPNRNALGEVLGEIYSTNDLASVKQRAKAERKKLIDRATQFAATVAGASLGGGGVGAVTGAGIGSLLKGPVGLIGGAVGGALGGLVDKGYTSAKNEAIAYADLRRSLGATTVDFDILRGSVRDLVGGLGISNEEAGKLASSYGRGANIQADNYLEIGRAVADNTGFARGAGIDPSQAGEFFATARLTGVSGNDQQSRRLALMIGEATAKAGMMPKMAEAMQSVEQFMATSARESLSTPNAGGFMSWLSGLVQTGLPGLSGDPNNAANMLSQADTSFRAGGASGEGSRNFLFHALRSSNPGMDALDLQGLLDQGLFGSAASAFGPESASFKLAKERGDTEAVARYNELSKNKTTNFDAVIQALRAESFGDSNMMARSARGIFGGTLEQNKALLLAAEKDPGLGELRNRLSKAGVDIDKVPTTSFAPLAQVAMADRAGLKTQAKKLLGMKLSDDDRKMLSGSMNGNDDELRRSVMRLTAKYDNSDAGSEARRLQADMENNIAKLASELIPTANTMKDGIVELVKKLAPDSDYAKKYAEQKAQAAQKGDGSFKSLGNGSPMPGEMDGDVAIDKLYAHLGLGGAKLTDDQRAIVDKVNKPSAYDDIFKMEASKYPGMDWRELKQIALQESGMNPTADNGTDRGLMQLNRKYDAERGVTNPYDPRENIRIGAKVYADNLAKANGNRREAFRRYNGSGQLAEGYADRAMDVYDAWHRPSFESDRMPAGAERQARDKTDQQKFRFDHRIEITDRQGNQIAPPVEMTQSFGKPRHAGAM